MKDCRGRLGGDYCSNHNGSDCSRSSVVVAVVVMVVAVVAIVGMVTVFVPSDCRLCAALCASLCIALFLFLLPTPLLRGIERERKDTDSREGSLSSLYPH